jgi:hypothetical protein
LPLINTTTPDLCARLIQGNADNCRQALSLYGQNIYRKETIMFRAIIVSLAAFTIVCANPNAWSSTAGGQQKEIPRKAEKKPRLGYEDPYFPPTKGHGF